MEKIQKTVNVSLQSKKYLEDINEIILQWKEEQLNKSTEICESILLREKVNHSPTLLKVISSYELTEKLLKLSGITNNDDIEEAFSKMISINAMNIHVTNEKKQTVSSFKNKTTENKEQKKIEEIIEDSSQTKESIDLSIDESILMNN